MNPWDQEGTHPDEWAFGGGALNSNEQTWEHQHENGTAGGAVPPSQKQDGEMSPKKTHSPASKVQDYTAPPPVNTTPVNTTRGDEYSGFKTALARLGEKILAPTSVERELGWQKTTFADNPEKGREFRDQVLQLQHFRAFALMRVNSPYITICHSIGKFFDPTGDTTKGWQGKYVGFVGDRKVGRDPFAIVLPEEAWDWSVPIIETNGALLNDFYKTDANYGHLYISDPPPAATADQKGLRESKSRTRGSPTQNSTNAKSRFSCPSQAA